ncbi:MAG: hypothetical protein EpisKO_04860 [Epibacterium sp.]
MDSIFLDPNMYCFSEQEWTGGDALSRLDALLTLLTGISNSENNLECGDAVSFILPDEILWFSYSVNPNINTPTNSHYQRLFKANIMPSLMRRKVHLDTGAECTEPLSDYLSINDSVARLPLEAFLKNCNRSDIASVSYAYHSQRVSLNLGSDCFNDEVCISNISGSYFLNPADVFPLEEKENVARALTESAMIMREQLRISDPAWMTFDPVQIELHEDFIPSITNADFNGFEDEYQNRIIYTVLQIIVSRDVSINEHSMSPQTVSYKKKSYRKWNAYVFQMGPNANDTRCSRLYFSKISNGRLLFRYEPDAHP